MEFGQRDLVIPLRSLKPKCGVTVRHRDGRDFHEWLSGRGSPGDGALQPRFQRRSWGLVGLAFNDIVIDANRASGELTVEIDGQILLT